ncbi:HTH-type transcriptional repressor AseR [bacterium BMS3Abin01]|nr:HTH-type transcriptional repressor AseR [bacterium BMS3Abin01]HDY69506.1 metalloregulator ArsR/SmtB family transcription factor [Actinomycetota bacterium]
MNQVAHIFKALSDDTRLRIVGLLLEGELCVCDLMAILELPQSTVSRHLAYLRHAGLVNDRRQGLWMFYRLADADDGLRAGLVALLRENLAELPQAEEDGRRLKHHLSKKQAAVC